MKLSIYTFGSTVLRTETEKIDPSYPELGKLIEDMFETMYGAEGVGLAAPQIGHSIRLFIVDGRAGSKEDPSLADFKITFINPEIYDYGDEEELMNEGCLSVPGIHEDVYRPTSIKIRYLDENFTEHDREFHGYTARVIQHEYDHLEAKMFVDRLSPLRKTLLKGRLSSLSKGKHDAEYSCKVVK